MSAKVTLSRYGHIALWVARVLVSIPFFIAASLEGLSSPTTLAQMDLVWIPGAPLWLVRVVAGIEGLAALGLILPGLSAAAVTIAALLLLVIQIAALVLDLTAGNIGDLPVKALVLALTLVILWARLRLPGFRATTETTSS
ncbi:MAG: DoxX family protein [Tabrizicola sp.]|nr:DoxX family protein [Tabrizicola sp.]